MNKKFFEAILFGIIKGSSSLVITFVQVIGGSSVFFLPTIVTGVLLKVIFANDPQCAMAIAFVLVLPMLIAGATLFGNLRHAYEASRYAEKHDCSIQEAWKKTEVYGSGDDF